MDSARNPEWNGGVELTWFILITFAIGLYFEVGFLLRLLQWLKTLLVTGTFMMRAEKEKAVREARSAAGVESDSSGVRISSVTAAPGYRAEVTGRNSVRFTEVDGSDDGRVGFGVMDK